MLGAGGDMMLPQSRIVLRSVSSPNFGCQAATRSIRTVRSRCLARRQTETHAEEWLRWVVAI